MRTETYRCVLETHRRFELYMSDQPSLPPLDVRLVRMHLIGEEISEVAMAIALGDLHALLGELSDLQYVLDGGYVVCGLAPYDQSVEVPNDPTAPLHLGTDLAKEIGGKHVARFNSALGHFSIALMTDNLLGVSVYLNDLQISLLELWQRLGLERARLPAFRAVHASQISKLGPDGRPIKNSVGRILKGPNYCPPDMAKVAARALG